MKGQAENIIKRILLAMVFGLLCISFVQVRFRFADLTPLQGYMEHVPQPRFSLPSWLEGKYQDQAEKYANEQVGFRPVLVRLRNQLIFTFFKETSTREVVVGKEQYLYEQKYIEAYLGKDFIGKDSIERRVWRLKQLQDTLDAQGVHLAVILAAGKASFFPQYIPDRYTPSRKSISNYDYYREQFETHGIHYIDFNQWFLQMKDTSSYPLYPKYGIHWSKYSLVLVADSILHYIEKQKGINLAELQIENIEVSDTARGIDYDMGAALNLLYKLQGYPLAYPHILTSEDGDVSKPAVVVIGDSYYSELAATLLEDNVFSDARFWFYNEHIYASGDKAIGTTGEIDPKEQVEKQDVVFLLATEANLDRLGFGAIETLYNAYYRPHLYENNFQKRKERIEYWKEQIRNNPDWLSSVEDKARKRGISTEEMIAIDAEYMVKQEQR